MSECRFGDERLSKRLSKLIDRLGQHPTLSIPGALVTRAELEAGYHFFDNEEVTPERILYTHRQRTLERIMCEKVCLLVQDTTELELTRPNRRVVRGRPFIGQLAMGSVLASARGLHSGKA